MAQRLHIRGYSAKSANVYKRLLTTALRVKADVVVKIQGEQPLIQPILVDWMIRLHLNSQADYTYPSGFSAGLTPKEIISTSTLKRMCRGIFSRAINTETLVKAGFTVKAFEAEPEYRKPHLNFLVQDESSLKFVKWIDRLFGKQVLSFIHHVDGVVNLRQENAKVNNLEKYYQRESLDSMPLGVMIPTGERCNLRCIFCTPRGKDQTHRYKDIDFERFLGLCDPLLLGFASFVGLYGWGEPLLNPEYGKM